MRTFLFGPGDSGSDGGSDCGDCDSYGGCDGTSHD